MIDWDEDALGLNEIFEFVPTLLPVNIKRLNGKWIIREKWIIWENKTIYLISVW